MIHTQLFFNRCFDKSKLKGLISWSLRNYGEAVTLDLVEKLKEVGFLWATKAGISLSIDDLKIPKEKGGLLLDAEDVATRASQQFLSGNLTTVERLQQLIDGWHRTSENLKQEVVTNFRRTDPLNPVYMMAFSGARGNISQVRQLVGMRGLMADPQGRIIDFPIRSNFREGLTLTEYVISCYGARKGIVDTALRTATSGYLTRRLVDVAQHVVVSLYDCETEQGIPLTSLKQGTKTLLPLSERILGRVLAEDVAGVAPRNTCISEYLSYKLSQAKETLLVRSPLLCKSRNGVCQLCYGWSLAHNELVSIGEAVGIIAAQSIGEPGTQLTMRTFHTGGVFSGEIIDQVQAPISGFVSFPKPLKGSLVRTSYGKIGFLTREAGTLIIQSVEKQEERKELSFPLQSILFVRQAQKVEATEILLEYASAATDQDQGIQATHLVTAPEKGEVFFDDVIVIKDELNTEVQAHQLGSFWLLTSYLHSQSVTSVGYFHYLKGDLITENSALSTTKLFNVTRDFSILKETNRSVTDASYKSSPPIVTFKVASFAFKNVVYSNGSYLTNLHPAVCKNVFISSQKQVLDSFFNQTSVSLLNFSRSLASSVFARKSRTPNLSLLLSTNGFWFLTSKQISSQTLISNFSKTKAFQFIKSELLSSFSESVQQTHSKRLGSYRFKKASVSQLQIHKPVHKFYKSGVSLFATLSISEKSWPISVTQVSFVQFAKPNNFVNSFQLIKAGENLVFKQVQIKPLISQLPAHFLFSVISRQNPVFVSFLENLVDNSRAPSLTLCCLSQKTACLSSIGAINIFGSLSSVGLLNKQTIDKSLEFKSPFNFNCQPIGSRINSPILLFQIQSKLNLDSFSWFTNANLLEHVAILAHSNVLLPASATSSKSSLNRPNEFTWQLAKKKLVNDYFILAQLNRKVSETIEIFKFLKKDKDSKMLSINKSHLTGVFLPTTQFFDSNSFLGSLIRPGTEILPKLTVSESGQILSIRKNTILIRKAVPILFSSKANFHVFHGDFIDKGLPLITLTYKRLTTGDIVQGIPRIEQLFEARQTTTVLHEQLHELFETYKTRMRLDLAARKSFQKIQRILIDSIQRVYQSQGVTISDKHLEVIVRQMTSTVRILEGGRTRLLRGELKSIDWIEKVNLGIDIQKAEYEPILLGITKASLETESFISAASFQETTRTLSRAAIEGRTDFLRGLKENVILGHRVPAGTGAPLISYLTKFSTASDLNRDVSSELSFLLKE